MIRIRQPVESDLDMRVNDVHKNEGDWAARARCHNLDEMWTVTLDGKPMIIFGYFKVWNGVGSGWAIVGKDVNKAGIRLTLAFRRFLDKIPKELGAHRVEFTVRSGEKVPLEWAKVLGFERESTLKNYGADKSDYELMVRHY